MDAFNVHTLYVPALGMESLTLLIMFIPGVGLSGSFADAPCVQQCRAEQNLCTVSVSNVLLMGAGLLLLASVLLTLEWCVVNMFPGFPPSPHSDGQWSKSCICI